MITSMDKNAINFLGIIMLYSSTELSNFAIVLRRLSLVQYEVLMPSGMIVTMPLYNSEEKQLRDQDEI